MAEHVLTMAELQDIFWEHTMALLGLDPETEDEKIASRVRTSWITEGAPKWSIDENICFIAVTESDDLVNRQKRRKYETINDKLFEAMEYTKVINCSFVFYGPDAYDHASVVKDGLSTSRSQMELAKHRLFFVPDAPAPMRAPELFAGRWWERTDFQAEFNLYVRRETEIDPIESIEVTIKNGEGLETNANIELE